MCSDLCRCATTVFEKMIVVVFGTERSDGARHVRLNGRIWLRIVYESCLEFTFSLIPNLRIFKTVKLQTRCRIGNLLTKIKSSGHSLIFGLIVH